RRLVVIRIVEEAGIVRRERDRDVAAERQMTVGEHDRRRRQRLCAKRHGQRDRYRERERRRLDPYCHCWSTNYNPPREAARLCWFSRARDLRVRAPALRRDGSAGENAAAPA